MPNKKAREREGDANDRTFHLSVHIVDSTMLGIVWGVHQETTTWGEVRIERESIRIYSLKGIQQAYCEFVGQL